MKILFSRKQVRGKFGGVKFRLWSQIELDENERQVIRHYSFDESVLIDSLQPELIRKSALVGIGASIFGAILASYSGDWKITIFVGLIIGIVAAFIFYDRNRETIFVKDLIHGRFFECKSVIDLARKEAWLETITGYLRQVMESAKHWGEDEKRDIEVLPKDEAKRFMIRGI